ncbi:MAG: MCE family protein [Candidatus Eisenbacteria bacterium]|uniref:MCE family protein n=1 Tax=Eiseniibacteriota bacterium TaxID=2212470 RepID=A0A849SEJ0_UNCEI|nr:MCE family protein [Candidatus Eisenbacteria bacterium]
MSRRTEIQVGITVLAALAIVVVSVMWLKDFSMGRGARVWTVAFPQTGGLSKSDEVQVNGIRKGAVDDVALAGDGVVVKLALASDVHLTSDSRVAIRNVGLMGEKVISVDLRTSGQRYAVTDTIPGVYEKGIPEVMAELGGTISAVNAIASNMQALASTMNENGSFAATLANFKQTSEELRGAVTENRATLRNTLGDFAAAARTARGLTTDREAQLRKSLDDFGRAAENMNRLSSRLDSLRASLQSVTSRVDRGEGSLGKVMKDDSLYNEIKGSIRSLNDLIADVKKNPKKYLHVSVF